MLVHHLRKTPLVKIMVDAVPINLLHARFSRLKQRHDVQLSFYPVSDPRSTQCNFHISAKMPPKAKLNVQSFPRPPLLEKISRHVLVKYQNQTLVETRDAYWALETHHPPSVL